MKDPIGARKYSGRNCDTVLNRGKWGNWRMRTAEEMCLNVQDTIQNWAGHMMFQISKTQRQCEALGKALALEPGSERVMNIFDLFLLLIITFLKKWQNECHLLEDAERWRKEPWDATVDETPLLSEAPGPHAYLYPTLQELNCCPSSSCTRTLCGRMLSPGWHTRWTDQNSSLETLNTKSIFEPQKGARVWILSQNRSATC